MKGETRDQKHPSNPVYRPRPFSQNKQHGPTGRRNAENMRHQGRRQWETPGPMCRGPGQGRAQKVPWPKSPGHEEGPECH
ncbi:hypothetical protein FQN60_018666, partial [Etheostoma spectabile]